MLDPTASSFRFGHSSANFQRKPFAHSDAPYILDSPLELGPGVRIDSYTFLSPIGVGGMGEVYLARDTRLGREVAIKVLPESYSADRERLIRFEQEARAAAALNHPNILAVYQLGTFEGAPYLVSELLEGETLRERLGRGPISFHKAIDYGVQVARGLAAAHEKGIVHRDLKPENVFLTKDGRVKILDFGLAKLVEVKNEASLNDAEHADIAETKPGVILGTSGYMAPEQVRGDETDHRADIFAFGSILREMVTGKRTFERRTSADTMVAILNEEPPAVSEIVPSLSPALQKVVQRCLEKNREQRFQSASDLGFALEALSDSSMSYSTGRTQISVQRGAIWTALAVAALVVGALIGYLWTRPVAAPKVANYTQLTHDGQPKSLLGTDGGRLYVGLGEFPFREAREMPVSGGEMRTIPMPSPKAVPVSLSPDGQYLLVVDGEGVPPSGSLWRVPVTAGSPRRLGDTSGETGAWSPDGKKLTFARLHDVFLANGDGTESHKLGSVEGSVNSIEWSPDGQHLRLDVSATLGQHQFYDMSADGKTIHPLLAGWHRPPDECCGRWTPDGEAFVFQSNGQIWMLPEKGSLPWKPRPLQLTSSPMSLSTPIPAPDGKRLYVVGEVFRGELMRYDMKTEQFVPFLAAISAEYTDFSRNGEWVAYVTYPEGTLWRSKVDGSQRMQLTFPPMYPMLPRWSPDGKEILFFEFGRDSKPSRIYTISPDGGNAREMIPVDRGEQADPNWSSDGGKIVFAGNTSDTGSVIRVYELATDKLSTVPGSQGMFSPRWSPDGQSIAAFPADSSKLKLFDFQTQRWRELAHGSFGWLNWSHDGQYLYILDQSGSGAVLRVRVSDHKVERVVDLADFKTTGRYRGSLSLAPDGSPLLLRQAGTHNVYAIDLIKP